MCHSASGQILQSCDHKPAFCEITYPYSLSAIATSLRALPQNKSWFWFFYLFYNMALLTFVKKLALISKKTSFIHSLQVHAGNFFSFQVHV